MQGFGWLAKLSWWFDVTPCPPWLTQIEWNKLPVVFEHNTPDWSSKDICDTCTNCSTSDRTEPLPFFQLGIRFFCDPHMTHMTRTNDINQKSLDIWQFVWMQVFEVEKLASNQTGDVPVCDKCDNGRPERQWWTNVSVRTNVSAHMHDRWSRCNRRDNSIQISRLQVEPPCLQRHLSCREAMLRHGNCCHCNFLQ